MFREVSMVEVREVLRLKQQVRYGRQIARLTGLDRKTVSRYLKLAEEAGFDPGGGRITDEMVAAVMRRLGPGRPSGGHGGSWAALEGQHMFLKERLEEHLTLTKIRTLLRRRGVEVPYRTLHRYCVAEFDIGGGRDTVRVDDGEPGHELQVDFGRLGKVGLVPGKRRFVKGLIFTACVSRHQFCWPTLR